MRDLRSQLLLGWWSECCLLGLPELPGYDVVGIGVRQQLPQLGFNLFGLALSS